MKKIVLILGFIVFTSFGASAQIKYQNGKLQFNVPSNLDYIRPDASTRWYGAEHIFMGSPNGAYFSIDHNTYDERDPSMATLVVLRYNGMGVLLWDDATHNFGNLLAGGIGTLSDARLKTDIRTISGATNTLLKLKPVTYRFTSQVKSQLNRIAGADGRDTGFLAQEVAQVLPNSVMTDGNGNMFINYSSIIPLLVKTVQEQNVRIDALEKRIANLENK